MGKFSGSKKKNFEVVPFDENGTTVYYICIKGTLSKTQPEVSYETYEMASEACEILEASVSSTSRPS